MTQCEIETLLGRLYDFLRDMVEAETLDPQEAAVLMDDVSHLWASRI